ncbi:hypothetical protein DFJ73DRAFT_466369 [Zopfochytrium polystomum]|nr:hypothetical protein DFJ73DRAFT_466369 [Zopfochytrium polystomum]
MTTLLEAATALAADITSQKSHEYGNHWRNIALRCIKMVANVMKLSLSDVSLQTKLIRSLVDLVVSDTNASNRLLALSSLAAAFVFADGEGFPTPIRVAALKTIISELIQSFPSMPVSASQFEEGEYVHNQVLWRRVVALHAGCSILKTPEASSEHFVAYTDSLIPALLHPTSRKILKVAALRFLNALPTTNANRWRIESTYRPIVWRLSESVLAASDQSGSDLDKFLLELISRFWSTWFIKPTDTFLRTLLAQDHASASAMEGYQRKRLQFIENASYASPCNTLGDCTAAYLSLAKQATRFRRSLPLKPFRLLCDDQIPVDVSYEYIAVEDGSQLSFNINPPTFQFSRYPFTKELHLQNKSLAEDIWFSIQTSPARFFSATPGFGVVPAGSSVTVMVSFEPNPYCETRNPEINGFLRVRSKEGLPFERIGLKAYNEPAVKTFPDSINFGFCPKGETKIAVFWVQNLLLVDCPCVMLLASANCSAFILSPSQATLPPREKRLFRIQFAPTADEVCSDVLYIVAFGGQVTQIRIFASGGEPIRLLDNRIDFGTTDIYYGSVGRRIFLQNRDEINSVPVLVDSSTDEIEVNKGKSIILKPGEVKPVQLSFTSIVSGHRQETIKFEAPSSALKPVEVTAFSGPAILIPVKEDIFFPTALTSMPSIVQIPISNLSNYSIQCSITVPPLAPFTMHLMDVEYANRKTLERSSIAIESKFYEAPDCVGVQLIIGPRITAVYEIIFLSATWGTFRVPMTTTIQKPKRQIVSTHFLNAVSLNEVYLSREKPLPLIQRFLRNPAADPPTGLLIKKGNEIKANQVSQKSSEVFDIEPPVLTCFGAGISTSDHDIFEFVTITNISQSDQPYQLMLSSPFYTEFPPSGEVAALSSIEIPIRLDLQSAIFNGGADTESFTIHGQITVFDSHVSKGMVSASIQGVIGNLLSLEVRKGTDMIKFPHIRVMEKSSRKVFLRNKASFEVVWEGRILPMARGATAVADSEWCPFGLSSTRMTLKPFELAIVDILFQATSTGEYKAKLSMNYIDPVTHVVNNEYQRQRIKRELPSVQFRCSAGAPDIEHEIDNLHFGDVLIGPPEQRIICSNNSQAVDAEIGILCPYPFQTPNPRVMMTLGVTRELPISFEPSKPGVFSRGITTFGRLHQSFIPVFANCGTSELKSNLGELLKLTGDPIPKDGIAPSQYLLDFGIVNVFSPATKILNLTNSGTFEMTIKNIAIGEDNHLRWRFLDDQTQEMQALSGFSADQAFWEQDEVDWDEIDFKAKEDKKVTDGVIVATVHSEQSKSTTGRRRRQGKSVSITNAPAVGLLSLSKSFPIRLRPRQTLPLFLSFGAFEKGLYSSAIRIDTERGFGETESFQMWIKGVFQPPLQVHEKKLDFGIRAVHSTHECDLKFTNGGTTPLAWVLEHVRTDYIPAVKFDPLPLPSPIAAVRNPIKIFPSSGKLDPGHTQCVDVEFSPNLPQYEVASQFVLRTENYSETPIFIHGIGASSRLVAKENNVNFGVLLVGTSKTFRLPLRNKGILRAHYFVESLSTQFSADPEQGLIEGDGTLDLVVTFSPKVIGEFKSLLRIITHSDENYPLEPLLINVDGIGSYPELVVHTKVVDFGVALFANSNKKSIRVENKGSAQARIIFSCHHPSICLEGGNNGEIVLAAHSMNDLAIVYTPSVVEYLDMKVFIKSSDSRGDYFMIHLKGSVGVPRLIFEPTDILSALDFGVCAVRSHQRKTFLIRNEGNIRLTYSMRTDFVAAFTDGDEMTRPFIPRGSIVTIDPIDGVLEVGEAKSVTISFRPDSLARYQYKLFLKYDFRELTAGISGIGGRAILSIDSPLRLVDFGTCRCNRIFRKSLMLSNRGNLGVQYHVRPEGAERDWERKKEQPKVTATTDSDESAPAQKPAWVIELELLGFRIVNPSGFCQPLSKTEIVFEFRPTNEAPVGSHLKLYFDGECESIELRGRAAMPLLCIATANHEKLGVDGAIPTVDLGVHPVHSEYVHPLQLMNESPFGIDFLVQPIGIPEFDVFPERGFIGPSSFVSLKVFFRPTAESRFQLQMKILWEREPLRLAVVGSGGIGKLDISYIDEKDLLMKGLDFGMVPFNTAYEKRFFLYNVGLVPIVLDAEVDNEDFTVTQIGDPFVTNRGTNKGQNKRTVWNWHSTLRVSLAPSTGVELGARFISGSATTSVGNILVRSECPDVMIPMRGKGGTITLSHKGDLGFGDIASNFTYSRKLTILNSGSIPSTLLLEWLVVGHTSEPPSPHIKLGETYSTLDPRSGFARAQVIKERGYDPSTKFNAKDYWRMVAKVIRKPDRAELNDTQSQNFSRAVVGRREGALTGTDSVTSVDSSSGLLQTPGLETRSRLGGSQTSYAVGRKQGQHFSSLFKRRQMLFHLITSTQLSSQSSPATRPFIRVEPSTCVLPSFGEVTVSVDLNLSTEDTFLATLLVKSNVPNIAVHEIPLTATPKAVSIVCDDTRPLNFNRQPFGEPETMTRKYTNVGHRDVSFRILNPNPALVAVPSRGTLKVGQSQVVQYIFRPTEEAMQTADIIFEPDCSQPIRLKMSGGGGFAKASLAKYRRFDFGHCMIGKETVSLLPITNEGNAYLHLTKFELPQSTTFYKGADWPTSRVSLLPGQTFNLALVFNPHEESPPPGRLVVGTNTESWEIELIGLGREAVLIVSKVALEFSECLIGNSYERKLGLKNVGDVNYPVTFKLEKDFGDLEFIPNSLVVNPFSESFVIVLYTPTKETRSTIVMTVLSPYSTHKVPVVLHAGTAILDFSSTELDFGMFERVTRPSVQLTVKNIGTVRTSFSIRDAARPSLFHIVGSKGLLHPGKSAEVTVTHIRHEVCQFTEKLIVRSDLVDKFYTIAVKGQCEEALLKPNEFALLNMGICPVLEPTTRPLSFTNFGRFPLEFSIKAAYPLKVAPLFGMVGGGQTTYVNVSWNPSGGYELRTQLTLVTNIGNYNVTIRGKAAFPELAVKNMYLDFGVCAVNHTYVEKFGMTNKGKVPLRFNIPTFREPSYSISTCQGLLDVKESMDLDVCFRPNGIGRFSSSFIIECKGVSYKEIVVAGIGGQMQLDISPPVIILGKSPCDLRVFHVILLTNSGDVTLHVTWDYLPGYDAAVCTLTLPEPVAIPPGRIVRCIFGAAVHTVGPMKTGIKLITREKTYDIPISGVGVRIILTENSRRILETEHLATLEPPGIFGREITWESEDYWLKRLSRQFQTDMRLVGVLESLYERAKGMTIEDEDLPELPNQDSKDRQNMQTPPPTAQSILATPTPTRPSRASTTRVAATVPLPHSNPMSPPPRPPPLPISPVPVDPTRVPLPASLRNSTTSSAGAEPSTVHPHYSLPTSPTADPDPTRVPLPPSLPTSPRSDDPAQIPLPASMPMSPTGVGSARQSTFESTHSQPSTAEWSTQDGFDGSTGTEATAEEMPVEPQRPTTSQLLNELAETAEGLMKAKDIRKRMVVDVTNEFLQLKRIYQTELDVSPACEEEHGDLLIDQILDYAHLKVRNIDLSVLTDLPEPNVAENLNPILNRPPPFPREAKVCVSLTQAGLT